MFDELLYLLCDELKSSWKEGRPLRVEEVVANHPDAASNDELMVDLICFEAGHRHESGEKFEPEEYCRRFPQYAEALREFWGFEDAVVGEIAEIDDLNEPDPDETIDHIVAEFTRHPPELPNYDALTYLDQGSFGAVFRARHRGLDSFHAIKVMGRCKREKRQAYRQMFESEAKLIAKLADVHIVRVMDCAEHKGLVYFTMELMEGSLKSKIGAPMPPREAAVLMEQVARGLHAAHREKIIHRDLKPGNILLDKDGRAKVADFGLAKLLGAESALTAGATVGTVAYMAPEQVATRAAPATEVDALADVYAIGSVLFHLLTGKLTFEGESHEIERQLISVPAPRAGDTHPPLLKTPAGVDLETICRKCLEKDPKRRYRSAAEVADRLRDVSMGRRIAERPLRWLHKVSHFVRRHCGKIAAALLLLAAAVAIAAVRHYTHPDYERNRAIATLAAGKPVVVTGAEPLPGPFRWIGDVNNGAKSNREENCFSVQCQGFGLFELMEDPQCDEYSFSAEVRHERAYGRSEVGLFFAGRESAAKDGKRGFLCFSFADTGTKADEWSRVPVEFRDPNDTGLTYIEAKSYYSPSNLGASSTFGRGLAFKPALPLFGFGPWRKIKIEVGPHSVTGFWIDQKGGMSEIATSSTAKIEQRIRSDRRYDNKLDVSLTTFSPRLSLGVFVSSGQAAFKNIQLIPGVR